MVATSSTLVLICFIFKVTIADEDLHGCNLQYTCSYLFPSKVVHVHCFLDEPLLCMMGVIASSAVLWHMCRRSQIEAETRDCFQELKLSIILLWYPLK